MRRRNAKFLAKMETGANCARYIIDLIAFKALNLPAEDDNYKKEKRNDGAY